MAVDRLNRKAPRVVRPCSPAQRGTLRDGLCRAHERDRYGVEHPSQERVRKAVCHESGLHGLEQGKGVSPTYCYKTESGILNWQTVHQSSHQEDTNGSYREEYRSVDRKSRSI